MSGRGPTVFAMILGLALPATAAAHDPGASVLNQNGEVRARVENALGGKVTPLDDGLLQVRSADGYSYTTHGPDFRTDLEPVGDHGGSIDVGDPQRPPACIASPSTDYYQEVLYGYPSSATNQLATKRADIQGVIGRIDAVLNEESLASGGPTADYKVRCEIDGSVKVSAFPVSVPGGGSATFTQIVNAAKAAGFTNQRADYSIFYDGAGPSGACGTGYMFDDETLSANNLNNNPGGSVSGGYAASYAGCWFGRTPMHENGHNEGAVQSGAPDSTGDGGHCDEGSDVMCYLDGGSLRQDYPQTCSVAPSTLHFDCAWDSYFDSDPEATEYLATHWNIGSSLNRFIRFGGPSPDFTATCVLLHCAFTDHSSALAGIASRSWSFGDGAISTVTNPSHDYAGLAAYTVTLTVVDGAGHSSSATRTMVLNDAFANAQQLTGSAQTVAGGNAGASKETGEPSHAGNAGGASVWYRWTPAAGGSTTIDTCGGDFDTTLAVYTGSAVGALTQVAANDDNPGVCGGPTSKSAVTFNATAGSVYRIAVDGWDGATGSLSLRLAQTVDTTAPTATITGGPNGPTSDANPSFSFAAGEPSSFECRLDAGAFAACGSPRAYAGLVDGPHVFSVRATDGAGNTGAATDRSFAVDATAPETTIDSGPAKIKQRRDASFAFSASEPGSTFQCRLDLRVFAPCVSPYRAQRPRSGRHTFEVAAVDALGHVDLTPATKGFKVKKQRKHR
ncbi:MAG: large repetitive protein [Solirubrobacterales bacterium]|jgi:PKD repeat protein|nr:large repetitive protein [Solirubrobacterales bacterium]